MRTLSVERTFALKQYENIKLFDQIVIPDGKEFDNELIENIRMLQFAQLELHFLKYARMGDNSRKYNSIDEAIAALEETKLNLLNNLEEI